MSTGADAGAYVWNIGTIGLAGTILGMPVDALFLGALAGLLTLGFNPVSSRMHSVVTVCTGTLLAGALSPVLIHFLALRFDFAESMEHELNMLRPIVPVLIGASWQWFLPRLSNVLQRLLDVALTRVSAWLGERKS